MNALLLEQLSFDFTAPALVEGIVQVLAFESEGVSCDELSKRLGRRRSDVLACLRSDPRFVRSGTTNGTRWTFSEGTGRNESGSGDAGELPTTPSRVLSQNGPQAVAA